MSGHDHLTPAQYIVHHLGHATSRHFPHRVPVLDFSYINVDTVFWSISMACLVFFFMWRGSYRATVGRPSRWQAAMEILVEFVSSQIRSIIPHARLDFIGPLSVSVFLWILVMNALDLLPVDLFPQLFAMAGIADHQRVVPTADVNGALGMSLGVLILMFYYGVKIKHRHFFQELFVAPFGHHPLLWIPNFILNVIEYCAKFVSLGLRLFGNMYAGELLFMLIALMGATATFAGGVGHFVAGMIWAIAHILIITLQAFIFMMLMIVYIGQSYEKH